MHARMQLNVHGLRPRRLGLRDAKISSQISHWQALPLTRKSTPTGAPRGLGGRACAARVVLKLRSSSFFITQNCGIQTDKGSAAVDESGKGCHFGIRLQSATLGAGRFV